MAPVSGRFITATARSLRSLASLHGAAKPAANPQVTADIGVVHSNITSAHAETCLSHAAMGPLDQSLGVTEASKRRTSSTKANISKGAYHDDKNKPSILASVKKVAVEGNIGCGKAQILDYLRQESSVQIFEEPIDLWRNKNGKNLLDLMYKDPKAHSFEFQQYVLETMVDLHDRDHDKPVTLLERSFYSARYVFIENLYRNGFLSVDEYRTLDDQFQNYCSGSRDISLNLILYVKASPETVYRRIMHRGRREEMSISVGLLWQLHDRYEEWLSQGKYPIPAPVLVIDGELPLKDVFAQLENHKDQILSGWSDRKHSSPVIPSFAHSVS